MTDITCTYAGDREQTLIAYLYDDIDSAERVAFDAHLPGCERCQRDLAALGGVRQRLAGWAPPEPQFTLPNHQSPINPQSPIRDPHWWAQVPAWAQVAAALLFLGVSAGV